MKRRIRRPLPGGRFGNDWNVWIGGILTGLAGLTVRLYCGSPIPVVRLFRLDVYWPPLWLMALLGLGWLCVTGGACGSVLGCHRYPARAYRAGMLFVLLVASVLIWYKLLFGGALLFLSLVVLVWASLLCLAIAGALYGGFRIQAIVFCSYGLWLLYLAVTSLFAFLAL